MDLWKDGTGDFCRTVMCGGRGHRCHEERQKKEGGSEEEMEGERRERGRARGEELGFQGEHTATPTES